MKKIFSALTVLLSFMLLLTLSGCGGTQTRTEAGHSQATASAEDTEEPADMTADSETVPEAEKTVAGEDGQEDKEAPAESASEESVQASDDGTSGTSVADVEQAAPAAAAPAAVEPPSPASSTASAPEPAAAQPAPQAVPETTQAPQDEPASAPVPEPEPTPAPMPEPEPAPAPEPETPAEPAPASASASASDKNLTIQFGYGDSFTLHLYDNETAAKIAEYVGTADWQLPIYHYDDYDNWEVMQFYDIPKRYEIPSNPQSVTSEKAGTVYYSHPNRIILFYQDGAVSSEYTPVGYVDFSQALVDAVENNPVVEGWGNKLVFIRP